ncbi:MAG: 50S ribosomal protein L10, partial [Clostridiales bacterium]
MDQNKKPQRIDKENRVSILRDHFANSQAVILADYRGVNVGEDTKLRASMRKANITYMIAKNTLIKRAANEV